MEELNEVTVESTGLAEDLSKTTGNKRFVLGILCGMLIATGIVGVVLLGDHLIRDHKMKAAVKAGTYAASGEDFHSKIVNESVASKIVTLESVIDKYYLNDYTNEDLETGIYRGMVDALGDKYGEYYTVEEIKKAREKSEGVFGGIGAYISYDEDLGCCIIAGTMEGGPAERAGLHEGDIIYKVDDIDAQGMDSSEVVKYVRGEVDTVVHLTLLRDTADKTETIEVDITREIIESNTVIYEMKEDNIGYIGITEFDSVTSDQFTEALAVLKGQGARGIIIDLRSNLGGNLDTACDIARNILPKGVIVYTIDKYDKRKEYTCDGEHELDLPLVMLVNKYSASASEVLTGAVKDYGKGKVVGTTTYGKGIVQTVIPLSDGSAVKLTTSSYYTPNGVCIHGTGIDPDVEVEFDSDAYYNDGVDNQLNAAMEEIHKIWESSY